MLITELGALLKANIPLIQCLEILARQYTSKKQQLILNLKKDISGGLSLSEALKKYPDNFDALTVHLIKAGEQSASLMTICENISVYQEKISLLKMRIKKALFYPVIIMCIALIITTGLLVFIVPQFEQLFDSAGAKLPAFTQLIISFSRFIQHNSIYLILLAVIIIILLYFFRKNFSGLILILPVLGQLYEKIILSRFAYTLSILLTSGIPLTQALDTASDVLQQKSYINAVLNTKNFIMTGAGLSEAFKKTQKFPLLFLEFIAIGEHSGQLQFFLNKIACHYDAQTDQTLNALTLLLEPVIMLTLGVLIGGLVIAMYLPVFQLGKIV